jgi:hypothetical protein
MEDWARGVALAMEVVYELVREMFYPGENQELGTVHSRWGSPEKYLHLVFVPVVHVE